MVRGPAAQLAECRVDYYYYYYYFLFDPSTQFPGNEKLMLCNTKKCKNQAAMNLLLLNIIIIMMITNVLITMAVLCERSRGSLHSLAT